MKYIMIFGLGGAYICMYMYRVVYSSTVQHILNSFPVRMRVRDLKIPVTAKEILSINGYFTDLGGVTRGLFSFPRVQVARTCAEIIPSTLIL